MKCLFTATVMQAVRSAGMTTDEIQKMKNRIIHQAVIFQQNEFQFSSDLGINLNILLIGDRMFIHTKADRLDAQEYFWMEQDGTWRTVPSDQIRYL